MVNALLLGVAAQKDLPSARFPRPGTGQQDQPGFGARTVLDGIWWSVSVLASETFGATRAAGARQERTASGAGGRPFREKVLIECCLELIPPSDLVDRHHRTSAAPGNYLPPQLTSRVPPVTAGLPSSWTPCRLRARANMTPAEIPGRGGVPGAMSRSSAPKRTSRQSFMAVLPVSLGCVGHRSIGEVTDGRPAGISPGTGENVRPTGRRLHGRHEARSPSARFSTPGPTQTLSTAEHLRPRCPGPSTGDESADPDVLALLQARHCSSRLHHEQYDPLLRGPTPWAGRKHPTRRLLRVTSHPGRGKKNRDLD